MPVHGLNHYNLRAARAVIDQLRDFYCEFAGLCVGLRPPFKTFGYWLYAGDTDVLHLSEAGETENRRTDVATTFDHVAFTCTGRPGMEERLKKAGIDYRVSEVPQTGCTQIFFRDPAGNGIELNFSRTVSQEA
jgi:glyoxylase I family protein